MVARLLVMALLLLAVQVESRDRKQVYQFRKENPCPVTGLTRGACPGYVVDHIIPLCAGGADDPSNMQWQDKATALEKDKAEWAICRWIRKAEK